jgi:DNA polymerase-3 subunit beta
MLRVNTSNPDLGEAKEDIEIDYSGSGMNVGFNARYLLDALSTINTETIDLSLEDDLSPGVFRPSGVQEYTCVVMPMRL